MAIERGYHSIRLDTLPKLQRAVALYRTLGFQEIASYNDNPIPGVIYFELKLSQPGRIVAIGANQL